MINKHYYQKKNIVMIGLGLFIGIALVLLCYAGISKAIPKSQTSDISTCDIKLYKTDLEHINKGDHSEVYEQTTIHITGSDGDKWDDYRAEIRGRGNYSWFLDKKGYQIKLSEETELLGMGAADTWTLIANHGDASLLRNIYALELGKQIGIAAYSEGEFIDLWIDDEYLGNYIICSKPKIGQCGIDLHDKLGVLVEVDNNYCTDEDVYFHSDTSNADFVCKDMVQVCKSEQAKPSVMREVLKSFEDYVTAFEFVLYADEQDWSEVLKYIDVESFVKFYLIEEFCENPDACRTSMYMYWDGPGDVIHMGPVWDFDLALGNCFTYEEGGDPTADYVDVMSSNDDSWMTWYSKLLELPEFRAAVVECYHDYFQTAVAEANVHLANEVDYISASAERNFTRWPDVLGGNNLFGDYRGHHYEDTWRGEVEVLQSFIDARRTYMDNRYTADFMIN